MVVGTPRYLAPEVLRGERATAATDVYSLGLTLHELLGGGISAPGELTPVPVRVPVPLEDVLARALAAEPARRPTAATIATLLDHLPALPGRFRNRAHDDSPTWPAAADLRSTRDDRYAGLRRAG
jgi:serine/threonine protein kinase